MPEREFPGRLTGEQWRALSRKQRNDLAKRAQCALLGSFRFCTKKRCRRLRSCCGNDPNACEMNAWKLVGKRPKTLREAYARLGAMPNA